MATLLSNKLAAPAAPARQFPHGVLSVTGVFTLAAALALNDVIKMVTLPKGATVLDVILSCTDLDTGAGAIILDVGDSDGTPDPDRYIDGANVGQAGGVARMNAHAGHGYTLAAEATIDVLVQVGPTTGATSGTVALTVLYTMDK